MDDGHLDYLACPHCRAGLSIDHKGITCDACHRRYKFFRDIPILSNQKTVVPELVSGEIATTLLAPVIDIHPQNDINSWTGILNAYIQEVCDQASASSLVLNLVDETKAVFKFLLNLSATDHILNVGPGVDNTSISLTRTAGRVTVLDLDLAGLYFMVLKKQFYGFDNIDLLFSGNEPFWPLRDHIFDAIVVQDSLIWSILYSAVKSSDRDGLDYQNADWPSGFVEEIKRVLKPEGSVYFGFGPYQKPDQVRTKLEETISWVEDKHLFEKIHDDFLKKCLDDFKNKNALATAIKASGFTRSTSHQISTYHGMPREIVCLPPLKGRENLASQIRSYLLRKRKFGQKGLQVGYASFLSDEGQSWIRGMVTELAQACDVTKDTFRIKKLLISRKGKLVVQLSVGPALNHDLIVKVPFYKSSRDMIANNYHTLKRLEETEGQLNKRPEFLAALPRCIHAGAYKGQIYFAEEAIEGRAWKSLGPTLSEKTLWRRILGMLANLKQLSPGAETLRSALQESRHRLAAIEELLQETSVRERRIWDPIRDCISESLGDCRGHPYFRKGDCSMHNILIRPGRHPAMIDFDEAGWSPFKTADLADLLFSYARTRKKINRAAFLKIMMQENYKKLGLGISMIECLDYLKADAADLKISILISWIDQVYHAIQSEAIKYRKYILKRAFEKILIELEPELHHIK